MTPSELASAIGGTTMFVAAVRVIFVGGKVVESVDQMKQDFAQFRDEQHDLKRTVQEHGERIRVLEYAQSTTRRHAFGRPAPESAHYPEEEVG